jgi:hypothetical protein
VALNRTDAILEIIQDEKGRAFRQVLPFLLKDLQIRVYSISEIMKFDSLVKFMVIS